MKSIMEEASSITKAIENAWNRAGQPQEFTVKILELPQTSFFGLKTSKSAKIALFFNEATVKVKEQVQKQIRPLAPRPQQSRTGEREDQRAQPQRRPQQQYQPRDQQQQQRPERPERPQGIRPLRQDSRPRQENQGQEGDQRRPQHSEHRHTEGAQHPQRREQQRYPDRFQREGQGERETWAPEMVDVAQDWLKETLVMTGKPDIHITPLVSHNYLKLTLSQPVLDDPKQEETQLKSWGSLAMEAVREKAHKPLRSLRIILESNPSRSSYAKATEDKRN